KQWSAQAGDHHGAERPRRRLSARQMVYGTDGHIDATPEALPLHTGLSADHRRRKTRNWFPAMKILVVTNLYPPHHQGGYELRCAQVIEYLQRQGHNVR